MKHFTVVICAAIFGTTIAVTAFGEDASGGAMSPLIKDYIGQVDFVEKQILALNEAMAGKEMWRPNDEVRSVSETYLHIAFGNYVLTKLMGFEPPASANFSMDLKKWDTQTTDAAKINDILKASFDHVRSVAKKVTAEQMEKKMDLFGNEMTVRSGMLTALNHMWEHLGQSIAYARMNNVVPPWTAAQQAAQKAKKEKAGK